MKKFTLYFAAFIFLLVGIAHLIRYALGIAILVGTRHYIPVDWSLYAGIVCIILSIWFFVVGRWRARRSATV